MTSFPDRPTWCRSCSAEIVWCWTRGRERMPVDVDPVEDGNITVVDGLPLREGVTIEVGAEPSLFDPPDLVRYRSHFASCPHADAWRSRQSSPGS